MREVLRCRSHHSLSSFLYTALGRTHDCRSVVCIRHASLYTIVMRLEQHFVSMFTHALWVQLPAQSKDKDTFGDTLVELIRDTDDSAGVLHTIIFNRALGPVRPREVDSELFEITYVRSKPLNIVLIHLSASYRHLQTTALVPVCN